MKLEFIRISGFRGYRKPVEFTFADGFTIIDGRNGAGKSTVFDAIEFALTGTISKYLDATASGESVDDYIWWQGNGSINSSAADRYVEVGFRDGEMSHTIRRAAFEQPDSITSSFTENLLHPIGAPKDAIRQLCTSTIIRDEHIGRLSLDLREGDRFRLLRDAIGAIDADDWIGRAQSLHSAVKKRVQKTTEDLKSAQIALASAQREIDEIRLAQPTSSVVRQAGLRLQKRLGSSASSDELADIGSRHLADIAVKLDAVGTVAQTFGEMTVLRARFPAILQSAEDAHRQEAMARTTFENSEAAIANTPRSTALTEEARQLEELADLGRRVGLRDGHCPVCDSIVSEREFEAGLLSALKAATFADEQAVERARMERACEEAHSVLELAVTARRRAAEQRDVAKGSLEKFDQLLKTNSLVDATADDIQRRLADLNREREAVADDLWIVGTVANDRAISSASKAIEVAANDVRQAEVVLGRARQAESRAKTIFDATRRAVNETLDRRLDRVLPLMSELYKRLRPHPIWSDVAYSVRGDVQRFLKLQVAGDINPQFVFSSGQRRATGLAFLLAVNLSVAWSRWRSILLDDPVQHIDDFRAVHLAEVLSHVCESGRQIICAVEDAALADLLCRRLPVRETVRGKRLTLGTDSDGGIAIMAEKHLTPHVSRVLVTQSTPKSA